MSRETALYRFFDREGRLLYVGIAYDPEARWAAHTTREWWPVAARHTVDWFPSREEAAQKEITAIKHECPLFNRTHTGRPVHEGVPIRELRRNFAATVNAAVRGQITYLTSRGRRVAAIVPLTDAEAIEQRRRAEDDKPVTS